MPNNYFRFKQFTVNQEHSAMKVCTDACLFGAWIAENMSVKSDGTTNACILDIGAGTGLLSLMLAQKTDAFIDAVEIDDGAFRQTTENFAASPWAGRLKVFHNRIQDFNNGKYDFIISNPPFYDNDLKSDDKRRNLALHSSALDLEELLESVKRLLTNKGKFAVLLPFHRGEYFERLATEQGFNTDQKVFVKQTPSHSYFRAMYLISKNEGRPGDVLSKPNPQAGSIIIRDLAQYTQQFSDLLKDYYL